MISHVFLVAVLSLVIEHHIFFCALPFFFYKSILENRRSEDKDAPRQQLNTAREGRKEEGLKKIHGPEWGITELDFEADYNNYQSPEMKQEYEGANKGVQSTKYRASRPGQQSVSGTAWMQQVRK